MLTFDDLFLMIIMIVTFVSVLIIHVTLTVTVGYCINFVVFNFIFCSSFSNPCNCYACCYLEFHICCSYKSINEHMRHTLAFAIYLLIIINVDQLLKEIVH